MLLFLLTKINWPKLSILLYISLFSAATSVYAGNVLDVLDTEYIPSGVVFEIKSTDKDYLRKILPKLHKDVIRLRTHHPRLAIAVVSHGVEEIALANKNKKNQPDVHKQVRSMVASGDVEFHVSGEVALRNGLLSSDFPDFIQVSDVAPNTINQFENNGYIVIQGQKIIHENYKLSSLINPNLVNK